MDGTDVGDAATAHWTRPSPKLWRVRLTELALSAVTLVVATACSFAASVLAGVVVAGVSVVLLASGYLVNRRRYLAWGYRERQQDLLVQRGVLVTRLTVVPYGRMQLVEVTSGMLERLYGLSTVKLHTAAAHTDARIPGLEAAEATRLRDRLAALGEARASGL
jgi:uncharacterized protein